MSRKRKTVTLVHMSKTVDHIYEFTLPDPHAYEAPLLIDSPHSGTFYPKDFEYSCAHNLLKKGEDLFVDELFATTSKAGGYFLKALFSRSYIDLNRARHDMDLALCAENWDEPFIKSERVKYGMGIIRRLAKPGVPVYSRKLTNAEIKHRLEHYYAPYHTKLAELTDHIHQKFGLLFHLNVHSMPSMTLEGDEHPDFVVGNRDGSTASREYTDFVTGFLREKGFYVTVNDPYKGVEIIKRCGNPEDNRHSLQLEINKRLYMDEEKFEKRGDYQILRSILQELMRNCAKFSREKTNLMSLN